MTSPVWLADLRQDMRSSWRSLAHNAGSSAAAILVLSCGIGLSVAIFSVADVVLRRPLPIVDEGRVVALWGEADGSMRTMPLTVAHFDRYRREARSFVDLAGTVSLGSWPHAVRDGDRTFRASLSPVTGNFFSLLGSQPVLGRTLRPEDDRVGAPPVAVISYRLWRGVFASSPRVLGRRFGLANGRIFTIVGVAPVSLDYPSGTEIWIPFAGFGVPEVTPVGRLRPGLSAREAAAELRASFEHEPASDWRGLGARAVPLRSMIVGDVGPTVLLLTVAAALVLLTACLNVSNLLLLRGSARRHEVAVRRALGASRWRILRQLILENVPVAAGAGLLGAWFAVELIRVLVALAPANLARLDEIGVRGVSLGLAVAVSCAAALGAGLLPAVWLSGDVGIPLGATTRSTTATRGTVLAQRAFVVLQVTLAVIVLFAAGVLGRSLGQLQAIETGLDTNIAMLELSWPDQKFSNGAQVAALYDRLLPNIAAVPGVMSAAAVNVLPFTGATGGWDGSFVAEGRPDKAPVFSMAVVGARYFQTAGVRLRSGRTFDEADRTHSPLVAIVSERAARLLWPGQNPVGKRIRFAGPGADWRTVVGVAPETRYRALREAVPTIYLPAGQFVEVLPLVRTIAVRTHGSPAPVLASIRRAVQQTDRDVAVLDATGISELVARQLATPRLGAVLVGVFSGGVLLLAASGLYSVLAGVVRARRRELAIRHAIGASPRHLRSIVLRQSLAMCACGVLLGLSASVAAGRFLQNVLYGVAADDTLTVAGVVAVLFAVTAVASYVPARRATHADAFELLRQE